jgi:hypothetical protein
MKANIECLPNINWSAKASAMDAFQRVPENAQFIAMWVDPETREIKYSKTTFNDAADMAVLSAYLQMMVIEWLQGGANG